MGTIADEILSIFCKVLIDQQNKQHDCWRDLFFSSLEPTCCVVYVCLAILHGQPDILKSYLSWTCILCRGFEDVFGGWREFGSAKFCLPKDLNSLFCEKTLELNLSIPLYFYIYLEPQWPLFLKVSPSKQGLFQAKQGAHLMGSRYIWRDILLS